MKNRKKWFLALAVLLCLSLAACGSDSGENNDGGDTGSTISVTGYSEPAEENNGNELENAEAPGSFEGLVKDSMLLPDENSYLGTWLGENQSELIVERNEAGDEVRFSLYDSGDDVTASGFLQDVLEYGADYFYNEHDGMAYRSRFADSGTLEIDSLGAFTKVSGDAPGENVGDSDYEFLAGAWYLDADANAASILEIDELGNWTLFERPDGDGDPTEVDMGTILPNPDGEGTYAAASAVFDDVIYDMTVVDSDVMYWGGENDYYQKLS